MKIRQMQEADIPYLVEQGQKMHRESTFARFEYSVEKCTRLGKEILENDMDLCIVAENEGEFCGFFIGYIQEYYFSDDLIAEDFLLYVKPTLRGGIAAKRLISYFESWSLANGARTTVLGSTTGVNEKKTIGFYEKLGYHHKGTLMQKDLI